MRTRSSNAILVSVVATSSLAACFDPPPDVPWDSSPYDAREIDAAIPPDPAMLATSQGPHDFGDVTVGGASGVLGVVVRNVGEEATGTLSVALAGTDAGEFAIVPTGGADDCFGAILDPQETCVAQIRFEPTAPGARSARVEISADPGSTVSVDLAGNGLSPGDLEITAGADLAFGVVEIQQQSAPQTVTVRNTGGTATGALTVMLSDTTNFTKTSDTCQGVPLGAGASCSIAVRFNPSVVGPTSTQISIRESPTVGVSASGAGTGSARLEVSTTGTGTVTSVPTGIACGASCGPASFTISPVQLTAEAGLGYAFDSWTGACAGQGAVCSAPLTQPLTTTTAVFEQLDCVPDTIVCNDTTGVYTDCSPTGEVEVQMTCPLGCSATSEQCVDVDPSNGLAMYLDMAPSGPDVVFSGTGSINTSTGAVTGANTTSIPSFVVTQSGTTVTIRVFVVRSLSITGTVRVIGTSALAFVSDGDISITGLLDASGDRVAGTEGTAGPGAVPGGSGAACEGGGGAANLVSPQPGGGGAGRWERGAAGGASGAGEAGGSAGGIFNDQDVVPLVGGCRGGYGAENASSGLEFSHGGPGGGAVQLVSRTRIALTSAGKVDVSGGGGDSYSGGQLFPGGGGGSGGAVLLEAPSVLLDGSGVVVSGKGGGGAAAGTGAAGHAGADGGTAAGAAAGGTNSGQASGGSGGTEAAAPTVGGNATSGSNDGAGGGGAVGQARFNTAAGIVTPQNGAALRIKTTSALLSTRLVP